MVSFKRVLPILVLTMAALPACADTLNVVANGSIESHAGEGGNEATTLPWPRTLLSHFEAGTVCLD